MEQLNNKKVNKITAIFLSLLMVFGMVSLNITDTHALTAAVSENITMTDILKGKEVVFYVDESVDIFDALQKADSRLAHLNNGTCFKNLTLVASEDGKDYYNVNGKNVTGLKTGKTTLLISGIASCGQFMIYETFNNTPIDIIIKKQSVNAPEASGTDAQINSGNGEIIGLDSTKLYEYSIDGVDFKPIPAGSTKFALPKGKYFVRFAETDKTEASLATTVIIKEPASTPGAPIITNKTDTTITIQAVAGEVYSIDNGVTWQAGPILTGAMANTGYHVIAKKLGNEADFTVDSANSMATSVITKKSAQQVGTPQPIEVEKRTDTSIAVKVVPGQEYSIDGGKIWNTTGKFATGLAANSEYLIKTRIAETDLGMASDPIEQKVKTKASAPSLEETVAPVISKVTDTSITVIPVDGQEYSIDGGKTWNTTGKFTGLESQADYKITTRIVETEDRMAGPLKVVDVKTKIPTNQVVPIAYAPEVKSYSDTTIALKTVAGEEYSIDGGLTWNKTGVFDNLNSNKEYKIVARRAETNEAMPGPISGPTVQTTKIASKDVPGPTVAPKLKATDTTVEVTNWDAKYEYSIDNGKTWNKPGNKMIFEGLNEGTNYTVISRIAETATAMPSLDTTSSTIQTLCKLSGKINAKSYPAVIQILDPNTGKLVKEIETDENGNYETLLSKGNYKLVIKNQGESLITDIELTPNDGDKDLTLKEGALVNGKVTDDKGNPIANATVVIDTPMGKKELTTDKQGNYYIDSIKNGNYRAWIYTNNGVVKSASTTISVKDGNMVTDPGTVLLPGVVTVGSAKADINGDGKLDIINNGTVNLFDKDGNLIVSTLTDENGSYILPSVKPGTYTLQVIESSTGAVIERTIIIDGVDNTGLGVTPKEVDGTVEVNAEKFIKNSLVFGDKVITEANGDNYKTILNAKDAWNELTKNEKDAVNKALVKKYKGMTYPKLLEKAEVIKENTNKFLNDYMTKDAQIISTVTAHNFQQIIDAKAAWDKLTNEEKTAVNNILVKLNGKTYEVLYDEATAIKVAGNQFIKDYMTINGAVINKVDSNTYKQILNAKSAWDKLTDAQKAAVNAELLAVSGMTYEEMLAKAAAFEQSVKTGDETNIMALYSFIGIGLLGAYLIIKRKEELRV
ncbi:carboxypeptidase regulatory-like domain-containing protein [Thomasclavelia sp.]